MIPIQQMVSALTEIHGRSVAIQTDMGHLLRYAHINFALACAMLVLMSCSLYVSSRLKRAQQAAAAATKDLAERQSAVIVQLSVVATAQTEVINNLGERVAALEARLGIQPPLPFPPPLPPPQVLM